MQLFKTTHETDWRRVQWVHDEEYDPVMSAGWADDKDTQKAILDEQRSLSSGALVALGALVELRCPHCKHWQDQDSLWGIVVDSNEDLEAWGTKNLDIPENILERTKHFLSVCEEAPKGGIERRQIPLSDRAMAYVESARRTPPQDPSIHLVFDSDTLRGLQTALNVRGMAGETVGLLEAFMVKLLEKLEAGETDWHVKQKKAVD